MKERLIKAEAFKEYCRRGYKNSEREFRSGTLRAFAKQITEDFCRDIDEQPTVRRSDPGGMDSRAGQGESGNGERDVGQAPEAVGEGKDTKGTVRR